MNIYHHFFIWLMSTTLLLLTSIGFVNYYIDPANQFYRSQVFEDQLASSLLSNNAVSVHSNYNSRYLKKIILAKMSTQPDILVLGSSRLMALNHHVFNTSSFYNAWVPNGTTIQDDIALYYLFQKRGWQPKTLIIGLDSWLLARNNGKFAWKALSPEFNAGKKMITAQGQTSRLYDNFSSVWERYSQLLSVDYLTASLKKIREPQSRENLSADNCLTCYIEYPDGSKTPSLREESTTSAQADEAARKAFPHVDHDNSFTELDPEYRSLVEQFIQYLIAQKVNVIFYLPPYEPAAYAEMQKDPNYRMFFAAEKYFIDLGAKYHIKVIGSYNPNQLGLTANDFYDDLHLKKNSFLSLFNMHYHDQHAKSAIAKKHLHVMR